MATVIIANLNGKNERDAVDVRLGFATAEDLRRFVEFFEIYRAAGGGFTDPNIYWLYSRYSVVLPAEQGFIKELNGTAIENMREHINSSMLETIPRAYVSHQKSEVGIVFKTLNLPSITRIMSAFKPSVPATQAYA